MSRLITAETIEAAVAAGVRRIPAPRGQVIVTPAAWSKARELGATIELALESSVDSKPPGSAAPPKPTAPAAPAAVDTRPGKCERTVDASGLVVVRGSSVQLGRFTGAGPDKQIGLLDLVTGKDGSPMTAGIMAWSREDSFPWTLDYDEVDLVLEGALQITIDGRTHEGGPGDVFYIPKGSSIRFGTPSRARVFYVTYPADWAGAQK